ncbi:MAG: tRNA (N(6)-L-threonylcarbamoyladenosine(37)-C(2))-methylthiotransferase MtaB [Rhodospirillaceae bacterium]|nr:tRNA (N(6)-L-threonylcarbamoyladenosine(37)-C(2))-methylthiotransferase MtaB [Rhodospirillaceae bacterium]
MAKYVMSTSPSKARVITFGCRLNSYESSVIRNNAQAYNDQETIVVNTCAVTAEAERQARQAIRKARREQPRAKIIVTGCSVQITPDTYARMPEVDVVVGNREKLRPQLFEATTAGVNVANIMHTDGSDLTIQPSKDNRTKAFVQVQTGCDHRCTFCIIPYGRGNNRSVPIKRILEEIKSLVLEGCNEVVLTGVNITSYGFDLEPQTTFGFLVKTILQKVPGLKRLRLSSLDPAEIDDTLWQVLAKNERLMPHLHLSVQAGHDLILKRMRRRHSRSDILSCVRRARLLRPNITFGADLIAGFPTETQSMFESTQDLIEECNFEFLHVFPYSIRKGTPAARMPMVPMELRSERAKNLRSLGQHIQASFFSQSLGNKAAVLLETSNFGRTENNIPVELLTPDKPNSIKTVALTRVRDKAILGRIV